MSQKINNTALGPKHWCQKLRWKSYGIDKTDPLRVLNVFVSGGVTFNCLLTAQPMGADDKQVSPENCSPSRTCYQEHILCTRMKNRVLFAPS